MLKFGANINYINDDSGYTELKGNELSFVKYNSTTLTVYLNEIELKQVKNEFYKIKLINCSRLIKKWYLTCKRNKILWKIAEYYTKKKYSPENILKYVELE